MFSHLITLLDHRLLDRLIQFLYVGGMSHPEIRHALIDQILNGEGPLTFQRKLQQARRAMPAAGHDTLLSELVDPSRSESGRRLEAALTERNLKIVTLLDRNFPGLLREIPDPPLLLCYRGDLAALRRPCIAIVGARAKTTYGEQVARQIAGELAGIGFTIVSGLAAGIDAAAHQAALSMKGATAGVLGSGLEHIYPRGHAGLAREMVRAGGLVLSEFAPRQAPKPFHFPIRNRIISGLARATLVIEAGQRSGSLITARHCLDQGRDLYAVPGDIHRPTARGTNRLIANGEAQSIASVEELVERLLPMLGLASTAAELPHGTIEDPIAKKIYERLDVFEPIPLDLLVAELKLDTGRVLAGLMSLETDQLIEHRPGQYYVRNPLKTGS